MTVWERQCVSLTISNAWQRANNSRAICQQPRLFLSQDLDLENDVLSRAAYAQQITDYFKWVKELQTKRCVHLSTLPSAHICTGAICM